MQNNGENRVYAGFFVRLAAYLIDWLIVGAALLVVRVPLWIASWNNPDHFLLKDVLFDYSIKDMLIYLLGVLYFIILTYFTGATLGKRVMCLRVVSSEEGKLTLFQVVYRETVGRFLSKLIMCVGYFIIGPDAQKRGLHDRLADTRVVYHHVKEVRVPTPVEYRTINVPIYNQPQGGNAMPNNGSPLVPRNPMPQGNGMPQNGTMAAPGNPMAENGNMAASENPMTEDMKASAPEQVAEDVAQDTTSFEE